MAYTISQGDVAASWRTDIWVGYWMSFDQTDWEDETGTNWSALGE
tara:strand:- start:132 stop:266 length:135 start_codon:yes stop_codon:yes gene_type:complete